MTSSNVRVDSTVTSAQLDAHFALAGAGAEEFWLRIGGLTVLLRFASSSMTYLTDAFRHLQVDRADAPDLVVALWDSPGQPMTGVPSSTDPDAPTGTRVVWRDGDVRGCYQPGQSTLSVLDAPAGRAWFWCEDAASLPYWEHAAPLRMILSWYLMTRGACLVHGAAVGRPDGGGLIVGRGGSGKSTTSLLSLLAGMSFASDDYVVVQREFQNQGPYVHSAFGSGKLDNAQCARFPELASAVVNPGRLGDEKAVFMVNRFAPGRMARSFPLRAVFVPRITGQASTRVLPANPMTALAALAPSTIFQLPGDPGVELRAMADLVRSLPVYTLALGTDFHQIPEVIDATLRSLAPAAARAGLS